jgi:hypothetical protein
MVSVERLATHMHQFGMHSGYELFLLFSYLIYVCFYDNTNFFAETVQVAGRWII